MIGGYDKKALEEYLKKKADAEKDPFDGIPRVSVQDLGGPQNPAHPDYGPEDQPDMRALPQSVQDEMVNGPPQSAPTEEYHNDPNDVPPEDPGEGSPPAYAGSGAELARGRFSTRGASESADTVAGTVKKDFGLDITGSGRPLPSADTTGPRAQAAPVARPKPTLAGAFAKAGRPDLQSAFEQAGQNPEDLGDKQPSRETPDNNSDAPDAQVPNAKLAKAVNATSAATTTQDVQNALERPHGVKDRSAYYAALKDIANAGRAGLNNLIGAGNQGAQTSFYDTKIKNEQEKQTEYKQDVKDWQQRVRDDVKQKYEAGQKGLDREEKKREFNLKEDENRLKAAELEAERASRNEDRDALRNQQHEQFADAQSQRAFEAEQNRKNALTVAGIVQGGQNARQGNELTQKAMKDAPDPGEVQAYNRVVGRLNDPTPIKGMTAGAIGETAAGMVPVVGDKLGDLVGTGLRSGEANDMIQDALTIMNGIQLRTTGKAMNEQEMRAFKKRVGVSGGEGAFRRGIKNELDAAKAREDMWKKSQTPQVQENLQNAGAVPEYPTANYGYPGHGSQTWGPIDEAKEFVKKRYSKKDAVDEARAQEDDEYRKKKRKELGIE